MFMELRFTITEHSWFCKPRLIMMQNPTAVGYKIKYNHLLMLKTKIQDESKRIIQHRSLGINMKEKHIINKASPENH